MGPTPKVFVDYAGQTVPIVDPDTGTARAQEPHDRKPTFAESDHHRTSPRKLQGHLSFNVARLNTANTSAMIQNRTITLGSGQPFFSKW